jgi:hypothetical protein
MVVSATRHPGAAPTPGTVTAGAGADVAADDEGAAHFDVRRQPPPPPPPLALGFFSAGHALRGVVSSVIAAAAVIIVDGRCVRCLLCRDVGCAVLAIWCVN